MKRVNTFVDMNTEIVEERSKKTQAEVTKGSSKRAGDELEQESSKRQKLEKEDDSTELKRCLEIVHKDDDDVTNKATPLSSKSPTIVDYKIYKEIKKSYFKIIRADGNSQSYLTFRKMFKNFDRENLEVLQYMDISTKDSQSSALETFGFLWSSLYYNTEYGGRLMKDIYLHEVFRYISLMKTKLLIKKLEDQKVNIKFKEGLLRLKDFMELLLLSLPTLLSYGLEQIAVSYRSGLQGKENEVNILKSIDEGPFQIGTFRETLAEGDEVALHLGLERPRVYYDLSPKENDSKEETIHDYYVRFAKLINDMRNIKMTMSKMQLNSKFVNNMLLEWGRFVMAVKLNRGHIARNCTQPKRPQNLKYFKDKMLLMQAQENGWHWMKSSCFLLQADECDAFDSDVDEAPTAQIVFMANLSSADPVYDEAGLSYDSNILSEYVKDNAESVVQNTVSFVPHDAPLIINEMHEQTAQCVSVNAHTKVVDASLTAKLAIYKEQVELSTINHNKSMVEEVTSLKKDFKQKENKYLKEFLDMKALKEKVEDRLFKQDQSLQTVYMLCKPKLHYDEQRKIEIGYKNPLYLSKAKQVQPALYSGQEIVKSNQARVLVHDSEDTLEIAETTRKQMNEKNKRPRVCEPHNYSKENYLAIFRPQKQLTPEQIFWSKDLIKMKVEALKEQTPALRPIKALTVNNREVHLDYLKHLKESIATLREIVEEAQDVRPLDRSLASAFHYTKHSQELLEYAVGTCPKDFNKRDNKHASTPLTRNKQVTFADQCVTCTDASGSKPRSNTKKNRISPAKSVNKKKVEEYPRTNKSSLYHTNRVDSTISSTRTSKKHTHKPKARNTNLEVLNTLHMDLSGPMLVQTINGKKYILVMVDDYSRFTWVKFLRSKDETTKFVIKFLKQIQVSLNKTFQYIRIDNGTEFVNQTLTGYYESDGIFHQKSASRTPQQNSVVKRQNHTLVEAARTMLIFFKASMFLWAAALDLTCLCVFGALCYPTNDSKDLGKLQPTADIGIFVGYAPSRKDYRIYKKRTRRSAPSFLMPGQISSWLVLNSVLAAPYVPPTNKELEILFQLMFDKYLKPPHVERLVSPATAVPVIVISAGTPSSTTIDQDAPSPSHSSSSSTLQSLCSHHGITAGSTSIEDNPLAPVDNDLFVNVFASEPSSEASTSRDVGLAESTHVTQSHHHLEKWSKDHITPCVFGSLTSSINSQCTFCILRVYFKS
uniref:Integrase catalytic domain-containing protein n=1 Tax=Tanacetum cinerariifolium TaxID=118510 RepID=A0A699GPK8_TANCI|nr:hypothetical protein [Tanacetum cinerariifolium]